MRRELKKLPVKNMPSISPTLKWWKGMSRYKRTNVELLARVRHSRFLADQERLERLYGLQPGETLGI
jgi:hypothetical protein